MTKVDTAVSIDARNVHRVTLNYYCRDDSIGVYMSFYILDHNDQPTIQFTFLTNRTRPKVLKYLVVNLSCSSPAVTGLHSTFSNAQRQLRRMLGEGKHAVVLRDEERQE